MLGKLSGKVTVCTSLPNLLGLAARFDCPRSPGRTDPSSMFFLLFSWLLSEGKPLGRVILSSVHFQEASGSLSLIKSVMARLSRALLSSCLG